MAFITFWNGFFGQILFDGPENRAVGVEYIRHGVKRRAFATKEVIISAGAMNSPQVLMLSGIGPKEHLESLNVRDISMINLFSCLLSHFLSTPFIHLCNQQ